MKIIVAGCGKTGFAIAKELSKNGHSVTVLDRDPEVLSSATGAIDVMGYSGDCTSIQSQIEADVREADLLIAVTDDDEINMLACLIARKAGNCRTIARIRSPQYTEEISFLREELGLSMVINPEMAAASEIVRLIQIPSALEVETFAKGRVTLISVEIPEGSPLDGIRVRDLPERASGDALICVTEHDRDVAIPNGDTALHAGDIISVALSMDEVGPFLNYVGLPVKRIKNVLIAGGSTMSYYLAKRLLELKINVKIIEADEKRCERLADQLPRAMIIRGNSTSRQLLEEESVEDMDAVCSLMGRDEENILLSLFVHKLDRTIKTITRMSRDSYTDLVADLPIGSVIRAKELTSDYITRYVRSLENATGSEMDALYQIMDGRVEALEFTVGDDYPCAGVPLKDLRILPDTLICSITRGTTHIRPGGSDTVEPGDRVVLVTTNKGLKSFSEIVRG